ncbi:MAG: carboxypeptidase-like regulatory domain-containing protein [Planctomycetota bacterium]
MRTFLPLVLAASLLVMFLTLRGAGERALGGSLADPTGDPTGGPMTSASVAPAPAAEASATEPEVPGLAAPRPEALGAPLARIDGVDAAPLEVPIARVFGVVIDSDRAPVSGLDLELTTAAKVWRAGSETPTLLRGDQRRPGFGTRTDEDGTFLFEVPVPTADWVMLTGENDPYLGLVARDFGRAGGRDLPALVPGDNDLGTLIVPAAGAVQGVVVDPLGAPIVGASVRLEGAFPGGRVVQARTDGAGHYLLGHLSAGSAALTALAPRRLAGTVRVLDVRVGETAVAPDLVLSDAPTISGVVVDTAGATLRGVRVYGWPVGGGRGAGADSDDDGRFVLALPQAEPYRLEVNRDPAFEPWGGRSQGGAAFTFEPGAEDVRIVLTRAARLTLRVLDAADAAPVAQFRVTAARGGAVSPSTDEERAQGQVTLSAAPGRAETLRITAPGYVPVDVAVAFDAPPAPSRLCAWRAGPL